MTTRTHEPDRNLVPSTATIPPLNPGGKQDEPLIARFALWSAHHRRLIFIGLTLILIACAAILTSVKVNTSVSRSAPGDTGRAQKLIDDRFGSAGKAAVASSQEVVVFSSATRSVEDPSYKQTVEHLMQQLRALRSTQTTRQGGDSVTSSERVVSATTTTYDTGLPRERSPFVAQNKTGGDVTFALVKMEGDLMQLQRNIDPVISTVAAAQKAAPDYQIMLTGEVTTAKQSTDLVEKDLGRSLLQNLPITFALLLLAFGSIVAGLVPLGLAFVSVIVANAILALISRVYPLTQIYTEMVLLMGLATGIDYALFLISRFRIERRGGKEKGAAILAASSTSGKSVAVAGLTVLLSISGLFLIQNPDFTSLAIAAIVVVALAVCVSLTVLPALLGDGLNRLHIPFLGGGHKPGGGIWGYICDRVLRHPWYFAVGTIVLLLAVASPVLTLNLGVNGAQGESDAIAAKRGAVALQQNFTLGLTSPAVVVVDAGKNRNIFAPDAQARIQRFVASVQAETASAAHPRAPFGAPIQTQINDAGDTAQILVPLNSDTGDKRAVDAIHHLRGDLVPKAFSGSGLRAFVTGQAAGNVDFKNDIISRTPIVFGFVLGLAFLILLVTFRSIVVPIKAILLNLLSVGATYGILVMVFQKGWLLEKPLGFHATGIIESWLPLFLFALLFGLSMDYHMFVLGRIKEAVEHGHKSTEAVALGIKATAGTITNAALIMVAVAMTFAFAHDIGIKQFGFGLAIAVLIDATLIRSILLPASMELLGERNWYLPRWLGWLPHIRMAE